MVIKGCIGFCHIKGSLTGMMLLVRGKRVIEVCLPYPLYILMLRLWKTKNILGKIFYYKPNFKTQLEKAKSL